MCIIFSQISSKTLNILLYPPALLPPPPPPPLLYQVNEVCERGSVCILEIDVQGAQAIKDSGTKARFLFITSSGGLEELEKRLRGRGTESEERIQKRLKTSAKELRFLKEREEFFDKVLVNDDLQVATEELLEAFSKWFPRLDKSSNL